MIIMSRFLPEEVTPIDPYDLVKTKMMGTKTPAPACFPPIPPMILKYLQR